MVRYSPCSSINVHVADLEYRDIIIICIEIIHALLSTYLCSVDLAKSVNQLRNSIRKMSQRQFQKFLTRKKYRIRVHLWADKTIMNRYARFVDNVQSGCLCDTLRHSANFEPITAQSFALLPTFRFAFFTQIITSHSERLFSTLAARRILTPLPLPCRCTPLYVYLEIADQCEAKNYFNWHGSV